MKAERILEGKLVRLIPFDLDRDVDLFAKWRRNSEYLRMKGSNPAVPVSKEVIKKWIEGDDEVFFFIQAIESEQVIGEINLGGYKDRFVSAFVGISIGEPDFWSRGYGSEAMQLMLDYGFYVMNLHKISLNVFEYNKRAIRSYEKIGFKYEGVARQWLNRDGQRWDMIYMGLLQSEWFAIKKLID